MKYKPDFLIIPYVLYQDERITALEAKLYGIVYYFANMRNERCTAANETLAEYANSTARSVQNSLTNLEKCGYIRRIFSDAQKKNRAEIIPMVVMGRVSPTGDTGVTHRLHEVSPTGDQIRKKDKEKNKDCFSYEKLLEESNGNSLSNKEEEYDVVPNEENVTTLIDKQFSPRKKADWSKERAVEKMFADECVKRGYPRPMNVPAYNLRVIRTALTVITQEELPTYMNWWFENGFSDNLLKIHTAFSAGAVNSYRGRNVLQSKKPKSNPKYDNVKTKKYENT